MNFKNVKFKFAYLFVFQWYHLIPYQLVADSLTRNRISMAVVYTFNILTHKLEIYYDKNVILIFLNAQYTRIAQQIRTTFPLAGEWDDFYLILNPLFKNHVTCSFAGSCWQDRRPFATAQSSTIAILSNIFLINIFQSTTILFIFLNLLD